MTAKQLLLEYVGTFTEAEAAETMLWLAPKADRELSAAERSTIERGLDDARNGRLTALEEIESDLNDA
jgi:predicted transcriptional regulator